METLNSLSARVDVWNRLSLLGFRLSQLQSRSGEISFPPTSTQNRHQGRRHRLFFLVLICRDVCDGHVAKERDVVEKRATADYSLPPLQKKKISGTR